MIPQTAACCDPGPLRPAGWLDAPSTHEELHPSSRPIKDPDLHFLVKAAAALGGLQLYTYWVTATLTG